MADAGERYADLRSERFVADDGSLGERLLMSVGQASLLLSRRRWKLDGELHGPAATSCLQAYARATEK